MTAGALANISAACLVAALFICLLCSQFDSSYDSQRPLFTGTSNNHQNQHGDPLLSLLYQPRIQSPVLKGSSPLSSATAVPPVDVLVCVEALCIDSKNYFHDQLMIAFNALGHDVMNLTVVPFGNAKIDTTSHTISCQHGDGECDTNSYEQCAIHLYPDPAQHVPYLSCLFASLPMGHRDDPFEQWTGLEPCAHSNHLDFHALKACHDDPELRWQLQTKASQATPTRHDHVPWVEVNGIYMNEESHNLLHEVCKAYQKAGGHAAGCSSSF